MSFSAEELAVLKKLMANPEVVTLLNQGTEYQCSNCSHSFSSAKPKRKCPQCGKFKLSVISTETKDVVVTPEVRVQTVIPEEKEIESNHIFQPKTRSSKNYGDSGEGRACRTEAVNIQTKCIDTGEYKNETQEFTNKVKFSLSQRRPEFSMVQKMCLGCRKTFEIHPSLNRSEWRCIKCIKSQKG